MSLTLFVLLAIMGLNAQQSVPKVIEAQTFIVSDADHNRRAALGVTEAGDVLLGFVRPDGSRAVTLTYGKKGGSSLLLYDEAGVLRLSAIVGPSGPQLLLNDQNKEMRVALAFKVDEGFIALYDRNGNRTWDARDAH